MNKLVLFFSAVLFVFLTAFAPLSGLDDVIQALRSGNASEISKYVDDTVEVSLPQKGDSYSRSQAVMILRDFFENNGVRSFETKFTGDKGGSQYCVGTLYTRSGNFRTTVLMKTKNGRQLVRQIQFQPNQ